MFLAALWHESNTFAPLPTGWAAFSEAGPYYGDGSKHTENPPANAMSVWRALAEGEGHEIIESVTAGALPGGRVVRGVYEALRDNILEDLSGAGTVDVVLLFLHGAMVADGYDDCEGDLLRRIRRQLGPSPTLAAELDLHCNVSDDMFENANLLVAYNEYPHTDILSRARELYALAVKCASGLTHPLTQVFDMKMIGMWRTTEQPMRGFVDRMIGLQNKGAILSVSLGHGFPFADVQDVGARLWVIGDGNCLQATDVANTLGNEFYALREQTRLQYSTIDQAMESISQASAGLIVVADVADNPGGGAPGDATFLARSLIEANFKNCALGYFWDPGLVSICEAAGIGARLPVRLGGKLGRSSGLPLDLNATVRAVIQNHHQTMLTGEKASLGASVWFEADGLDFVVVSRRFQVLGVDGFTDCGIDLRSKAAVVVKSTQHFYSSFAPLAADVLYVTSPGALNMNFEEISYTKRDGNFWPRIQDPRSV